jgi:hypothetical protein
MFSEIVAMRAGNTTRKGTMMTSGPRPRAHEDEETPTSSAESLEESTERTAKVMDDARKQVDRARQTFHDQIMGGPGSEALDYQDHGSERGPRRETEPEPEPEPEREPEPEPAGEGDDTKAG